jgi:hypothetical protein
MFRFLGIVVSVLLCVALAIMCSSGDGVEHKGQVIAGRDDDGVLVALLGVCNAGVHVTMDISVYVPAPDPKAASGDLFTVATAERDAATVGMLVELRNDRPPKGWSSDSWSLPDEGTFFVTVTTDRDGSPVQVLDATVNLAEVPPFPANAEELAIEEC